jgi:hypothetical protein
MDKMFKLDKVYAERNNCTVCRWKSTEMCPYDFKFVGRHMVDIQQMPSATGCHRFVLTAYEQEYRDDMLMTKLALNIARN